MNLTPNQPQISQNKRCRFDRKIDSEKLTLDSFAVDHTMLNRLYAIVDCYRTLEPFINRETRPVATFYVITWSKSPP